MHNFKFPRYTLLVHKNNCNIHYLVEGRYLDIDKGCSPVYLLTPSSTNCMERWGAEYVEASFEEYIEQREEENESH